MSGRKYIGVLSDLRKSSFIEDYSLYATNHISSSAEIRETVD